MLTGWPWIYVASVESNEKLCLRYWSSPYCSPIPEITPYNVPNHLFPVVENPSGRIRRDNCSGALSGKNIRPWRLFLSTRSLRRTRFPYDAVGDQNLAGCRSPRSILVPRSGLRPHSPFFKFLTPLLRQKSSKQSTQSHNSIKFQLSTDDPCVNKEYMEKWTSSRSYPKCCANVSLSRTLATNLSENVASSAPETVPVRPKIHTCNSQLFFYFPTIFFLQLTRVEIKSRLRREFKNSHLFFSPIFACGLQLIHQCNF